MPAAAGAGGFYSAHPSGLLDALMEQDDLEGGVRPCGRISPSMIFWVFSKNLL